MHRRLLARLLFTALCGAPLRLGAQSFRIAGEVTDSVHRAPLADATVLATPVAPTRDTVFHSARTDVRGRFELAGLQAGKYEVSVDHPFTDSIGLPIPSREAQATADGTPLLALALPSVKTLRRTLCRAAESDTTLGVMLGVVRRTDGSAVQGANVVFEWTDVTVDRATLRAKQTRMSASTISDSVGVYRACGVPAGIPLFVQAQRGAREQSGVVEEHIGEAGVLVRELVLGDSTRGEVPGSVVAAGTDSSVERGDGVVRGVVLAEGAHPVANARVHLFGTSRSTTTNASGEFRLADIPTGTQGFEIIALGYAPRRLRAEVSATTAPMTVTMSRIAAVLDSVRVTARRLANGGRYNEFDERSRHGHGRYITAQEIERRHPFVASDLLRVMPGVTVSVGKDNEHIVSMRRCMPAVYLDGMESAIPLDEIPTSWIRGIEVYQISEIPSQYRGRGLCGVILVWTN